MLQLCQNGLADGGGQFLLLSAAHARRLDGRQHPDAHRAGRRPVAVGLEQPPCAGDRHRHHRGFSLHSDAESTGLELTGAALLALVAGTLGEDDEAPAALYDGSGVVEGAHRGADVIALDEDTAQQLHPAAEQGDLFQLLLGEDAVGLVEAGQQQGDVIIAAMVRHKNTGSLFRDVVQPLDAEPDAGDVQDAPAPVGDMLLHQTAHRLGVAGGLCTLGFAQHAVVDDHVAKQIGEHRNGAENAHREIPPFG